MHSTGLEESLTDFLFQYRPTPHSTTKVAELLFNRQLNSKIPSMNEKIVLNKHQYAKDNEQKAIEYQKNYANKTIIRY